MNKFVYIVIKIIIFSNCERILFKIFINFLPRSFKVNFVVHYDAVTSIDIIVPFLKANNFTTYYDAVTAIDIIGPFPKTNNFTAYYDAVTALDDYSSVFYGE